MFPRDFPGQLNNTMFDGIIKWLINAAGSTELSPDKLELLSHTLTWYYKRWPYVNDTVANMESINMVSIDVVIL